MAYLIRDLSSNIVINTNDTSSNVIISTGNTNRVTISNTGAWTWQGGMSYNNVTNALTATTFIGDLSGNATNAVNIGVSTNNTSSFFFPAFFSNVAGNLPPLTNTSFTYQPSTNTLSCNLNGIVNDAVNAYNIDVAAVNTNATFYPTFVSATTGQLPPKVDTNLTFNPSTNTLTTTNFSGLASTATNIAGGAGGEIPYQSSANTTALLANGTAGQVLTSQGTILPPIWSAVSGGNGYTSRLTATGGNSVVDFFQNGVKYRCHIFTSNGTFAVSAFSSSATYDICLIGGGAGGSNNGGGGAGAIIVAYNLPYTFLSNIGVTVGNGGTGGVTGADGSPTSINLAGPFTTINLTAQGGGRGGSNGQGRNGYASFTNDFITPFNVVIGSSGGGGSNTGVGGSSGGDMNQFAKTRFSDTLFGGGRAGGSGVATNIGGGGGGAGGAGGNASGSVGGAGGTGFNLTFDGTLRQVCGGGGGGGTVSGGAGGFGGGFGGTNASGANGTANTGGGGGGGTTGGNGGSGLVMIRYVVA